MHSWVPQARAVYSASVLDSVTRVCFFEPHTMVPPCARNTYPVMDTQLLVLAKLVSIDPVIICVGRMLASALYITPHSLVPCRYLKILLAAVQCRRSGFAVNEASVKSGSTPVGGPVKSGRKRMRAEVRGLGRG